MSKQEKERREKIERENEILLRKILDCHHGVDRSEERRICVYCLLIHVVKLRRGLGKDRQGMAVKAKGLKA